MDGWIDGRTDRRTDEWKKANAFNVNKLVRNKCIAGAVKRKSEEMDEAERNRKMDGIAEIVTRRSLPCRKRQFCAATRHFLLGCCCCCCCCCLPFIQSVLIQKAE